VSEILHEDKKLRDWFLSVMWNYDRPYPQQIADEDDINDAQGRAQTERELMRNKLFNSRMLAYLKEYYDPMGNQIKRIPEDVKKAVSERVEREVAAETGLFYSKKVRAYISDAVKKKMLRGDYAKRRWRVDSYGKLTDSYEITAHHMFYNKDPIWKAMVEVYKDTVAPYNLDYNRNDWVDYAWTRAQESNDREFKRFYYAAVAAKFLEGHMKAALHFINNDLMKELDQYPDADKLKENARNLKITIEMPDARDPKYAGLYLLWHPKQIYAAVKTVRKTLKTDKIFMTIDWEHIAGHGVDPLIEIDNIKKVAPDFGKYVLSVHSNAPNPLHAHYPIELGDMEIYKLNYFLRETGFGKHGKHHVYLWFERGGGDDPFRQAVTALKLCAKFLEKDIPPDKLPEEYFGLKLTGMDFWRQEQIMRDHRFEPLKDLLEIPEEEWGLLSAAATKKGKTKEFKKGELR
jgi:hypothetical protein